MIKYGFLKALPDLAPNHFFRQSSPILSFSSWLSQFPLYRHYFSFLNVSYTFLFQNYHLFCSLYRVTGVPLQLYGLINPYASLCSSNNNFPFQMLYFSVLDFLFFFNVSISLQRFPCPLICSLLMTIFSFISESTSLVLTPFPPRPFIRDHNFLVLCKSSNFLLHAGHCR